MKLRLSDVKNEQPLFDFLHAVSDMISGFLKYWLHDIQKLQDKREQLPDLYKLVELFHNDMRITNIMKKDHSGSTATFQNKSIDDDNAKSEKFDSKILKSESKQYECLCDKNHQF